MEHNGARLKHVFLGRYEVSEQNMTYSRQFSTVCSVAIAKLRSGTNGAAAHPFATKRIIATNSLAKKRCRPVGWL